VKPYFLEKIKCRSGKKDLPVTSGYDAGKSYLLPWEKISLQWIKKAVFEEVVVAIFLSMILIVAKNLQKGNKSKMGNSFMEFTLSCLYLNGNFYLPNLDRLIYQTGGNNSLIIKSEKYIGFGILF